MSASEIDVGVDDAESEFKVKRQRGHEWSAEAFSKRVIEITIVGIVVIVNVSDCSARACISMPVCNDDILACICLLVVNIKARGGMMSQGTRRGAAI